MQLHSGMGYILIMKDNNLSKHKSFLQFFFLNNSIVATTVRDSNYDSTN